MPYVVITADRHSPKPENKWIEQQHEAMETARGERMTRLHEARSFMAKNSMERVA